MWLVIVAGVLAASIAAGPAAAQPDVGISATTSRTDALRLERRPPRYEGSRPGVAAEALRGPSVTHDPLFIGPTLRIDGGELGLSMWIAPSSPVGSAQTGWRDVNGWASVGVTFTWGMVPAHPSPGRAIR
jgi:hypothetical protein